MAAPDRPDRPVPDRSVPDRSVPDRSVRDQRADAPWRFGERGGGTISMSSPGGGITLPALSPQSAPNTRRGGVADGESTLATLDWWIGAEDRWHVPAREVSRRHHRPLGAPITVTSVRIPSGDATAVAAAARPAGADTPVTVLRVTNDSPIPVALAFVVSSDASMTVNATGVAIGSAALVELARPALGFVVGADAYELHERLEAGDIASTPPAATVTGWVALVVPLPHTAEVGAIVRSVDESFGAGTGGSGPYDANLIPPTERIMSGWAAHLRAAPVIEWPRLGAHAVPDGAHPALEADPAAEVPTPFSAAVSDVLVGVDADTPAAVLAEVAEAHGMLGMTQDLGALVELRLQQHRSGRLRSDDPIGATSAFIRAVAAWWGAGMATDVAVEFVGAVAAAGHWLARGRRRPPLGDRAAEVADSLAASVPMLRDLGQPEVAVDFGRFAQTIREEMGRSEAPGALGEPGRGAGPTGAAPTHARAVDRSLSASCRTIRSVYRSVVSDDGDGLDLLVGWDAVDAGRELEVRRLPTRFGWLSFAVRWHGERPALLWEVEPWQRGGTLDLPHLTVTSIDPAWSTSSMSGEALLSAPGLPMHVPAPPKSQVVTRDAAKRVAGGGSPDRAPDGASNSAPDRSGGGDPNGATFS